MTNKIDDGKCEGCSFALVEGLYVKCLYSGKCENKEVEE